MKQLVLSLLLLNIAFVAFAQQTALPVDSVTKKITYSEVVTADGSKKDELYLAAKNWALSNGFKAKTDSKAEGKFVANGQLPVEYPSPVRGMNHTGVVKFLLTVSVKDGRYKYEFTDFVHESQKGNGGPLEGKLPACGKYTLTDNGWATIKAKTPEKAQKLVQGLKDTMAPVAAPAKKSEDW